MELTVRTGDEVPEVPEVEARDPHLLSPAEQSELLAGHPWSRFAVMGDSIALGVGDPTDGYLTVPWGERIAAALAAEHEDLAFTNLARFGATSAEVRDEQLGAALEFRPDLVTIVAGGNDLFAKEFDIAAVKATLDQMVGALMDAGATVVTYELLDFGGTFEEPALKALGRRLEVLYAATREIAEKRGTVHVDMFRSPWARERYCFSADLMHPTMRAQALAASATIRALGAHLRRSG